MQNILETVKRIRMFREGILQPYLRRPLYRRTLKDVKRVVLINSSSRSGSSLLHALLCKLPGICSLSGEAAPFYKLNTTAEGFNLFDSDKIPQPILDTVIDHGGLARDLFSDLAGTFSDTATKDVDIRDYGDHVMLRLALQWTDIQFEPDVLRQCIERAFADHAARHPVFSVEDFYLGLLEEVTAAYPQVNPFYYDLSTEKVALRFPFLDLPEGPPNSHFIVEEPPFILLAPRRQASPEDLTDKVLLLKSTVDCHRMNLIEKIFPGADIRVIYLVRNPAATTNGLYDGWLHRGFFSHNLRPYLAGNGGPRDLSIKGYSDRFEFGRSWWNFDLPEGWQDLAEKSLLEVCAFQWNAANTEILHYLSSSGRPHCIVRYEDMIRSIHSRREQFERLLDFIGVPAGHADLLRLDDLPVVQATLPPQLYRWKKRKDLIVRLLDDPRVLETSVRLGYERKTMEDWL